MANRPAIEYQFEWLARSGIERVILALGLHNDDLAAAYPPGEHFGIRFQNVLERQRLESGGAIRNAVDETNIRGRFLVMNGDVIIDMDLDAFLAAHEASDALVTMALSPVDDPSQFGVAVLDGDDMIAGFHEKPPPGQAPSNLVNAGAWIFEPGAVEMIPPGAVRVEETLFPSLAEKGRLRGFTFDGLWADYGTATRYLEVNQAVVTRAGSAAIAPTVSASPDSLIIDASIGERSTIGPRSLIEASVLWEGVTIEADASVRHAILADGVQVGAGAVIDGLVAGSNAHIAPGARPPSGTIIEAGETYG